MVTKENIAFYNPGDDVIVDQILLNEVELIQDMSKYNVGVDAASFASAIVITTSQHGHNAGRTYYLQAESREDCTLLVARLTRLSRAAARREKATSLVGKIRIASRIVYESPYFQGSTALMILVVRYFNALTFWITLI